MISCGMVYAMVYAMVYDILWYGICYGVVGLYCMVLYVKMTAVSSARL